jgi:hypothetical protein
MRVGKGLQDFAEAEESGNEVGQKIGPESFRDASAQFAGKATVRQRGLSAVKGLGYLGPSK